MDKLKKVFAWFLLASFALMFQKFLRSSSHLYWFPATIATLGFFASAAWVRRLYHSRHSLSLHRRTNITPPKA
jgi:hypothetical protein